MHPTGRELSSISTAQFSNETILPSDEVFIDPPLQHLRKDAISYGLVTGAAQAVKFLITVGSTVVLARLLSPADFGLVAMVVAITTLLAMFKDAGLSTATVQKETITHGQISNLFWVNVALGLVMTVLALSMSPVVAWFYRDQRVVAIMCVLSTTFLLNATTVQHQALLLRQMRFGVLAAIDITSMLGGLGVGLYMAWGGATYWALVGMQVSTAVIALLFTWQASLWRPSFPRRGSGALSLVKFGAHLTASDVIIRLTRGSDAVLVGRVYGADSLGLYTRGGGLLMRPLEQLLTPLGAVLVPVLSRLQTDAVRYRRTFLRAYDVLAIASFIFTALLLALSHPIVLLILGPKWDRAADLFAGFAVAGLYIPLAFAVSWLFLSQGRGRDWLGANVVLGAITLVAYALGLPYGPAGMVTAIAVSGIVLRLPVLFHLGGRSGPVRTSDLWASFLSNFPCWVAACGATTLVRRSFGSVSPAFEVLVAGSVGIVAGFITALAVPHSRAALTFTYHAVQSSLKDSRLRHR